MPAFKVLITDGLKESGQVILRAAAAVEDRSGLAAEKLLREIPNYHALIVRSRTQVTAELLERAEELRVIGRAGVGVDNIDLEAARARQVIVVNAPESTSLAVAELTLGLMLALARGIPRADAAMKQGGWLKAELSGLELNERTLGILGMGRIGTRVARLAAAFGMRVLGYDPHVQVEEVLRWGAEPVALDELYARSDFIALHLPLSEETRGMLDEKAFQSMNPGVRIICPARGGIIDEPALLRALDSGQVAGAALDVFSIEPPGATDLVVHPHVIATPHIGAQTQEAQDRAARDIAEEVLAALRDEPMRWRVV